ncbi:hypothetical protein PDTA9759_26750 [Phytobacter diazotrophicus]|uniref:Secreted protein n=1 Tax=Phytobacter diazotrophicus TaxID=395631 RepID=A0ABN6LPN9_9ENTR|nr:hypothetical protein PDTA9734_26740 [Phytobacter diazotrophicus]BEG82217.1 hypothetical protein PDTA9730_26730 [Phytobacter diazotrophicus]BEG88019.1 hypothetical protein PDTA9759_26750 [Phytobacter diazotrophicus]BEG93811.1 hypothetical protein PDTA9832_26700 [Phytobacter diazotrophicus]
MALYEIIFELAVALRQVSTVFCRLAFYPFVFLSDIAMLAQIITKCQMSYRVLAAQLKGVKMMGSLILAFYKIAPARNTILTSRRVTRLAQGVVMFIQQM